MALNNYVHGNITKERMICDERTEFFRKDTLLYLITKRFAIEC